MYRTVRFALLFGVGLALAACDAGVGPDLAGSPLTPTSDAQTPPPDWFTFYPTGELNRRFSINRTVTAPGSDTFRIEGGVHVTLNAFPNGPDGFHVRGHANAQGLSVTGPDGTVIRVTGADNVDVEINGPGMTTREVSFNVITPGPDANYDLYLTLSMRLSNDGGVMVAVTDARLEAR